MRMSSGTSVVALAMFALATGCVADGSDSSSATTEPPPQPVEESVAEADQAPAIGLPDGYDIVRTSPIGASPVGASGDGARTALRRVAAVGRTDADPRLIEYTLYEFDDEAAARAAAVVPSAVSIVEPIALERGGSVGFVQGDNGLGSRLGLAPHGPGLDAFFQTFVAPTVLAVGGSAVIQPEALAPLLESLSTEAEPFGQGLPDGMAVLVDETPLRGTTFEVRSTNASTTVEWYPGVSRSWFEYFSWGIAADAIEPELVDLGIDVWVRPPQSYGLAGAATDPEQTMVWGDERLLIVTHRDTTPSAELAELVEFFLKLDEDDVAALTDSTPSDAVPEEEDDAPSTPERGLRHRPPRGRAGRGAGLPRHLRPRG